ncbi:NAD(P)/FAD-dependent oxidoreductase [soil metagenome]
MADAHVAGQPCDLIIVGAGPAGLSAAETALAHGLRVAVIDEQHDVGGQIFRQPPASFRAPPVSAFETYPFGAGLLQRARAAKGIDWRFGTTAWGVFPQAEGEPLQVAISCADSTEMIEGRHLLIATGAYDLPVAFPGWTLPGVMSAGGVQTLVKSQFLRPGRRFVLAGSHPLLLLVADLLVRAGADVAEVAIARPMPRLAELMSGVGAVPGHVGLLAETARSLWNLRRRGVPLRFGTLVTRAQATADGERLCRVVLSDVDTEWRPKPGTERTLEADTLVIGYGLLASTELARQAGCAAQWVPAGGGWIVRHDERMQTTVSKVYVAGEPAGVKGAELAWLEGRLAALNIVAATDGDARLGQLTPALQQTRSAIRQAHRFTDEVLRFFEPRLDALARLAIDDTLVCRCEEVTASTVVRFLAAHPHVSDVSSVKLACRTGMGPCQGRYCQHTVAHLLADARGMPVAELGIFEARAPVKPVSVRALSNLSAPSGAGTRSAR